MHFQSWRVSTRIQFLVALALIGLLVLSVTSLLQFKDSLLQDRKEKTRNLVESVHTLVMHYQDLEKSGALSQADASAAAIKAVKAMRYEGKEYFWINDLATPIPKMVMHPTVPSLDGKVLDDPKFNCATSLQAGLDGKVETTDGRKNLFVAFAEVANRAGSGYVTYNWPKPKQGGGTTAELFPKMSFVMKLDGWDWVIGSGIYIDDVDQVFHRNAMLLGGISISVALLLSLLGWGIGTSILRLLGGEPAAAMRVMQQVSGGDLTASVGNPPAGSLLAALGAMVASLQTLIAEINASGYRLVRNAEHIKQAAEHIASAAERESAATAGMVSAIGQLTGSVAHISDSARETEQESRDEMAVAGEGTRRVGEATTAIQDIVGTVTDAAQRIHTLEERALHISSMATVIKQIANQTNLLALNAAIEAARAGEQGRGFAVVADEVRKLAERTASATTEIEQMISAIQSDTDASVQAMNGVLPRVEEGVRLASAASTSLATIELGAGRTIQRVAAIANATREQSNAATSITQRVEQIAKMAVETSVDVQQTADTARELESIARELKAQIERFKV